MNQKKFGTFAGVFTPSILTILGVMMYLRFGAVVGNAGLIGTIAIIVFSHIISISTGLSVSSIATDKKVGAGGVYYVLSRSLGLPIGGSLGLTLFVATAFSIALYMVGFAEVIESVLNLDIRYDRIYIKEIFSINGELITDPKTLKNSINLIEGVDFSLVKMIDQEDSFFYNWSSINVIRFIGSVGLIILTLIALISTSVAIKSQFIILALIILSLIAIGIGDINLATQFTKIEPGSKLSYFEAFALFFPAVTGFTAGVAMSGDLKDPKKSIPRGTMFSILTGFIIYLALALFIHYNFSEATLIANGNILYEITMFGGIFVVLGAVGATLSSALGGILGGPRILQAMSVDKITPKQFAKGVGENNEPRNALILSVIIAQAGILIGELDVIATILTMFYLAAYGFINLSFFLESWASADFNPSFKVKKWIGLIGFIATFTVMSQLNMLAMIAAFIIIGGIYFYLNSRRLSLGTGDIWQSVWSTIVKKGLRKMEAANDHKRNWKPNILMFSGGTEKRGKLIEFSKAISGQTGIITNFDLIENTDAKILFPKHKQTVQDEELNKYGIFGRQIEVQNEFKGIESIASTFGFSGIEPNTTLIPWPGETKDPIWFTEMTQKLIDLDYNVLYLDYDKRWGFRKKEQIDLWWRNVSNNAELMLSLAKFISTSSDWVKANIRILLVNDSNTENHIIEKRIQLVVDQFRLKCKIKIISNKVDQIPIYELMKINSADADLVFVGIPEIEDPKRFIELTNELVNTIGTTLLVKASSHFEETDLKVETIELKGNVKTIQLTKINELIKFEDELLTKSLNNVDNQLELCFQDSIQKAIEGIELYQHRQIAKSHDILVNFLEDLKTSTNEEVWTKINEVLETTKQLYIDDIAFRLPEIHDNFSHAIDNYIDKKYEIFFNAPSRVNISSFINKKEVRLSKQKRVKFRVNLERVWEAKLKFVLKTELLEFGYHNYILLHQSKNVLHHSIRVFAESLTQKNDLNKSIELCLSELETRFKEIDQESLHLASEFYKNIRNADRSNLNFLGQHLEYSNYHSRLKQELPNPKSKIEKENQHILNNFSGYWNRNIVLFSLHLQSDIYLIQYTAKLEKIVQYIVSTTQENYISPIHNNIQTIEKNCDQIIQLVHDENNQALYQYTQDITNDIYFNLDGNVQYVLENIQDALDLIPEEVELMNAHSINNIRKIQGKSVSTIKIQLDDITDYLTKIHFFKPFQDHLTDYIIQLKKGVALILNITYKIQQELELFTVNSEYDSLLNVMNQAKLDLQENSNFINSIQKNFLVENQVINQKVNESLDVNKIVEQYETLYPQAKKESNSKRLSGQFKQYKFFIGKQINKLISKAVQQKQEGEVLDYSNKYKAVLSDISLFQAFFKKTKVNDKVVDVLPFYYQQLFTGKHFSDTQMINNRKQEIEQAEQAIDLINANISGGMLIIGESLSGKSFLSSHIAHHLLKGHKIYRLKLPRDRNKDSLLLKSFQNATGIQKQISNIFNKVEKKSIFIIEDIEKWWLNTEHGDKLLNQLGNIMDQYGNSHYFILSVNLFAYQTIKKQTNIGKNIVGSILLNPLSNIEIREVIESRHQLGGMRYAYKNTDEAYLSKSKQHILLNKYYTLAKGNIGLALRLWISSIENVEENKINLAPLFQLNMPEMPNEIWQSISYQFQIHKRLQLNNIYEIYGPENKNWIDRNLAELVKAGLIINPEKDLYEMPSLVRYFIEKSLYE